MLLTAGALWLLLSQSLKRDAHATLGPLVQPPTQLCGVGQKVMVDLPGGRAEGRRKCCGRTRSAQREQEVLRGEQEVPVGKAAQETGGNRSTPFTDHQGRRLSSAGKKMEIQIS